MNIIELVDIKATPDIIHEYSGTLKTESTPLIIDNGSYKCRVGWSSDSAPLLEFRNLIAKPRKDRKKEAADAALIPTFQIGNDIVNIEAVRLQLKTQFDRQIVTHFNNQEQILDYIFTHLNIDGDGAVPHPILMTEALGNPNYCRQQMNELLFEGYGVPAINYGIDALFSWQHNINNSSSNNNIENKQDALILSFGYHATHVVPMLDGQLQADRVRRLNIGGYHIITYLYRLMQMKYPVHLNAITISRMETLLHQHSAVAVDYQTTLKNWSDHDYYIDNVKRIQLPFVIVAPVQVTAAITEQRIERRKELARRLVETNARRAKEKQLEDEQQLDWMLTVRQMHEDEDMDNFKIALQDLKLNNVQALDKNIAIVRGRLERMRQRLENPTEIASSPTPKEKTPAITKPPQEIPLEHWISDIRDKRGEILKRKHVRKVRRQDMVKRHTAAAQQRMRIISQLARNEKGTDEFGIDDNDWDVYKAISRDNESGSESETENERLVEYENILRNYDTNTDVPPLVSGGAMTAENYQLHVGIESLRAPELLFQPSMIGSSEAGLAELINYVLKQFSDGEQQRLADNVFMTGGCAQFPQLKERLSKELLEMRPFQTTHRISMADAPELDAWLGARDFAKTTDFKESLTTRQDYEENGSEFFKTNRSSNPYVVTPKQVII